MGSNPIIPTINKFPILGIKLPKIYIMKFPKHMIMDFESKNQHTISKHWSIKAITESEIIPSFISDLNTYKVYTPNNKAHNLNTLLNGTLTFNKKVLKIYAKNKNFSLTQDPKYFIATLLIAHAKTAPINNKFSTWYSILNINFLRKERLYTKLKYSRSPAYDMVSGGAAAIFAGFIGFLISEKFGFELADSGDFYYLFMYLVFIAFMFRPIMISLDLNNGLYGVFKLKEIKIFYVNLISLLILKVKSLFFSN